MKKGTLHILQRALLLGKMNSYLTVPKRNP